ncbi:MAG: hypothetical protein M3R15_03375 [Acidobacteriota bacterium]|nr:hypothetical protein [Acidobacteriota bacterium]
MPSPNVRLFAAPAGAFDNREIDESVDIYTSCMNSQLSHEVAAFNSPAHRAGCRVRFSSKPCQGAIAGVSPLQGWDENLSPTRRGAPGY